MLSKWQPFPDFQLVNHRGATVTKEDLMGHWTVVYFFMKDYSDICTKLAKDFTALSKKFRARGCEVWGVSVDSVRSHSNVVAQHNLFQSLISDPEHQLMSACGVWGPKKVHGKEVLGAHRTTFIIDPEGLVRVVMPEVVPRNHPPKVVDALSAAQKEEQELWQ
jgi:peroxiredoxin Q/BCP